MNISIEEDEDEAEHLLNVLLEDESRPYGSRVKSLLDVASDNDGWGAAVEESNPESNPSLVVHDSPTAESPPNNGTQSPVAETPRPKTPTTLSSLSPAPSSRSASPFIQDQLTPGSHTEHVSDVVSSTRSPRNQGTPYYCAECEVPFKSRFSYLRHMRTSRAHATSGFQCCCERLIGRKTEFRNHIMNPNKRCEIRAPYVCLCGYKVENNLPNSMDLILQHIETCVRRRR